jgi:hypothetical protein
VEGKEGKVRAQSRIANGHKSGRAKQSKRIVLRLDGMADLIDIVLWVSFLRGTTAASRNTWAMTVQEKLHDIKIYTVRDFIKCSQLINGRLLRREHKALHFTMMKLLLRAACDDIFGEGGPGAEASVEAVLRWRRLVQNCATLATKTVVADGSK